MTQTSEADVTLLVIAAAPFYAGLLEKSGTTTAEEDARLAIRAAKLLVDTARQAHKL